MYQTDLTKRNIELAEYYAMSVQDEDSQSTLLTISSYMCWQ